MAYWIINSLIVFALSGLFAGVLIPQILLIAYRKKLFDEVNERKIHKGLVPRLGGMAFVPVIMLSIAITMGGNYELHEPEFMIAFGSNVALMIASFCCMLLLFLVGLADDLIGIKYKAKFVAQVICAMLLISAGCWFSTFAGVFGVWSVNPWFGYPFTAVVIVFVINATNLIDGIDGLCSGLSSITSAIYGISFLVIGDYALAMLSFATLGVLVPFFYYNVFGDVNKHKKIFMGDTGSLTIGLILSILGIMLYITPNDGELGFEPAVIAYSPLIVPSFDVIRVYFMRIRHHRSPFLPDKSHIHHKFLAAGMKPRYTMVTIILISVIFTLFNLVLSRMLNITFVVLIDAVIWIGFNYWLDRKIAVYQAKKAAQANPAAEAVKPQAQPKADAVNAE